MITYKITTANYYVTVDYESGTGNIFTDLIMFPTMHDFPEGLFIDAAKYRNIVMVSLPNYTREEVSSMLIPKNAITSISIIE